MKSKKKPVEVQPDFWERLDIKKQHGICLLFLFLLPIILIPEVWTGKQFAQHDMIQWRAAAESLMEHKESTGEDALWATDMFSGMPSFVISNVPLFYSLDYFVYRAGKSLFPYMLYVVLLAGSYVFFLTLGARPLAAAFGAVVVAFTTYIPIIIGAGHNTKFYAYAWTPWMLAGFSLFTRGRLLAGLALFTLFFSFQVRAGHPQVTYYFLFLLAVWWVFEVVKAVKENRIKPMVLQTAMLLGAGVVVAISVLPHYWALADYAPFSIRGGSALAGETGLSRSYAFTWSQGWGELLTLLIPNLYGGGELYWGPKPVTSGPHYLGAFTALFFAFSFLNGAWRRAGVFMIAGALGVLFSLGYHFALLNDFMFSWFPGFNKFRTPEMWLMLSCFSFSVPAVLAFDAMFDAQRVPKRAHILKVSGGLIAVALLIVLSFGSVFTFEKPAERRIVQEQVAAQNNVEANDPRVFDAVNRYMARVLPQRREAAMADAFRFVVFILLGTGGVWLFSQKKIAGSTLMAGLLVVTAFDMLSVANRYMNKTSMQPRTDDVASVIEAGKRDVDTWLQENLKTDEPWTYRALPLADNPFNNAVPSYFYASAGGYSGAKMSVYQDIIDRALFAGPMGVNTNVLNMLNIRYLTLGYPLTMPGFSVAAQQSGQFIIENESVKPKAWFAGGITRVQAPDEAMKALLGLTDNSDTAVVESGDSLFAAAGPSSVSVTAYGAHEIVFETESTTGGFMVIGEIFYPAGWTARTGDTELPIYKTNYAMRGIQVPAGSHRIEMTFRPGWYTPVRTMALAAHLLIVALVLAAGAVSLKSVYQPHG